MAYDVEHIFQCLFAISISFLVKLDLLALLSIFYLFVFLLLSFKNLHSFFSIVMKT